MVMQVIKEAYEYSPLYYADFKREPVCGVVGQMAVSYRNANKKREYIPTGELTITLSNSDKVWRSIGSQFSLTLLNLALAIEIIARAAIGLFTTVFISPFQLVFSKVSFDETLSGQMWESVRDGSATFGRMFFAAITNLFVKKVNDVIPETEFD